MKLTAPPGLFAFSVFLLPASLTSLSAADIQIKSPAGISVSLDEDEATYQIVYQPEGWTFAGQISHVPAEINNGPRHELASALTTKFPAQDGFLLRDSIRIYDARPIALFTTASSQPTKNWPTDFPNFTTFPHAPPIQFL